MSARQISFDPLDFADNLHLSLEAATSEALHTRNSELRLRRKRGEVARGWRLTGQLRPYAGFGIPDGRVRTVYYITVEERTP